MNKKDAIAIITNSNLNDKKGVFIIYKICVKLFSIKETEKLF